MLIMVDDERMPPRADEVPTLRKVRFRTLGWYPLTSAFESNADTLPAVIQEMLVARTSERQGRLIENAIRVSGRRGRGGLQKVGNSGRRDRFCPVGRWPGGAHLAVPRQARNGAHFGRRR